MTVFILKDFGDSIAKEVTRLELGAKAVDDMVLVMTRIAEDMLRIEAALFSSQGRRGGGSWKRLKPDTVRRKGHATILVETGHLKASLTEAGHGDNIMEVTNTTMEFGTIDPIAQVHEEGMGVVPRRPVIKVSKTDEKRWDGWIIAHLMRSHVT